LKKVLITGICGQDGAYLAASLISEGYHVIGLTRKLLKGSTWRLDYFRLTESIEIREVDQTDQSNITQLIRTEKFVEIYNLSAQSSVAASWDDPVATSMVNSLSTLYIIEAIKNFSPMTKLFQASTSEMYGSSHDSVAGEKNNIDPKSPYGVSKAFSHQMVVNYREAYDLKFCCGILYGHGSPLSGIEFVIRKISNSLAAIKLGSSEVLRLGNIDVKRDWGYALEYVEGMKMMLRHPISDDFVLATGQTTSVRSFVNYAAEALELQLEWSGAGLNEIAVDRKTGRTVVQIDPRFYRPLEMASHCGLPGKAHLILGWRAQTDAKSLAQIMIKADYDRLN
jgi:GDPmannose 4,6-dehydratase